MMERPAKKIIFGEYDNSYDEAVPFEGLIYQADRAELMASKEYDKIELWHRLEAFGSVNKDEFEKYIEAEWPATNEPVISAEDFLADLERL